MTQIRTTELRRSVYSVTLGAVGLRVVEYVRESAVSVRPIAGLVVTDESAKYRAAYHVTTGVYGFLDLPSGPLIVHIRDPRGRYLPRRIRVEVPDRSEIRRRLLLGETTLSEPEPLFSEVALRPSIGIPRATAQAALWGVVSEDGVPLPYARVEVTHEDNGVLTYADAGGVYVAPLRWPWAVVSLDVPDPEGGNGEEPDILDELVENLTLDVRVDALRIEPQGSDPFESFPTDFEEPSDFENTYRPGPHEGTIELPVGERVRRSEPLWFRHDIELP